ncbi:GNAT family N-acetyltransferase [Chitinimonas sp. PSY-7]|uniref:GNAT family N-acetyltransferase n=1 Tax=Chitinimonas sp. PSY-7 TaxID=3459088 RepID=UPI00404022DE
MCDFARGNGRQVRMAWRGEQVVGGVGWVLMDVVSNGCAYGAPLIAADEAVAESLVESLCTEVQAAGATRVRVTARALERAKHAVLKAKGFVPVFEFVNFVRPLRSKSSTSTLPQGLYLVPLDQVNWSRLQACYADCFADVPNAPAPTVEAMQAEWSAGNWQAGCVLADETGEYQAFCLVVSNHMEAVGIREVWRGKALAPAMYARADAALLGQGYQELKALVASSNPASMRLHQKLGFTEGAPRWTTYELVLA